MLKATLLISLYGILVSSCLLEKPLDLPGLPETTKWQDASVVVTLDAQSFHTAQEILTKAGAAFSQVQAYCHETLSLEDRVIAAGFQNIEDKSLERIRLNLLKLPGVRSVSINYP